jgi:hypothetical protein
MLLATKGNVINKGWHDKVCQVWGVLVFRQLNSYAKAVLKFVKLNTVAQQREAVTRGRSLLPYRLRYT